MKRREQWRPILNAEVKRWAAKSYAQLRSELSGMGLREYIVEFDSERYQVEVELLENTDKYVHVMVAVDDGSLPASIFPLTYSFIQDNPEGTPTQR